MDYSVPVSAVGIKNLLEQWYNKTIKVNEINKEVNNQINNVPFEITTVTMTGRKLTFQVFPMDKIINIKHEIYKQDGLLLDQQRLVFNGSALDDDKCIHDYDMNADSRIHLVLRLRGGMFHETSSRKDYISIENKHILQKGINMIRFMKKYGHLEILDQIHAKLIDCTDIELIHIVTLIEEYYTK